MEGYVTVSYGMAKRKFIPFSSVLTYEGAHFEGEYRQGRFATDRGMARHLSAALAMEPGRSWAVEVREEKMGYFVAYRSIGVNDGPTAAPFYRWVGVVNEYGRKIPREEWPSDVVPTLPKVR